MKIALKIVKYLGIALGLLILLIGIYLLMVFLLPRIPTKAETSADKSITIYILSNGVHTDIVVPVKTDVINWSNTVKYKNTLGNDSTLKWLGFGWGDKGFYLDTPTWADLKFSTAFKAAFALSSSAIHATYHGEMIEDAKCRRIRIGRLQYIRLVNYIANGFMHDGNGNIINIKTNAVYGKTDAFYEGVGSYSLFYTCNTWTNSGLKYCGQKACLWTPLDKGIINLYK